MSRRQFAMAVGQVVRRNSGLLHGTTALVFLVAQVVVLVVVSLLWPVGLVALVALVVALTAVGHVVLVGFASVVVERAARGSGTSFREVRARLRPSWWRLACLSALGVPAVGVGLALGVVPGVLLWTVLSLAVPVVVLERTTVSQAVARSRELLSGRWKRTSYFLVLLPVLAAVYLAVVNYVSVPPYRHYSVLLGHDSAPIPMLLMITVFAFGWSTFLSPWFAVVTGMVYAELNTATRKTASEITSAP